jgi:gas vesicle protein
MTDIQGDSEATQAARDAAERVRTSAANGAESFGATAEQIADEVSVGTEAAKSDVAGTVSDIANKVSEKVGDVVDGAKSAASEARAAAGKAADAAVDAAKAATASIKDVADDVDFDDLVARTKTVAREWTDKLKQTYRERPGVVIAAAAGAVVVLGAIVRSIGRR